VAPYEVLAEHIIAIHERVDINRRVSCGKCGPDVGWSAEELIDAIRLHDLEVLSKAGLLPQNPGEALHELDSHKFMALEKLSILGCMVTCTAHARGRAWVAPDQISALRRHDLEVINSLLIKGQQR